MTDRPKLGFWDLLIPVGVLYLVSFVDYWGKRFVLYLDSDGDGWLNIHGKRCAAKVVGYSYGPDKKDDSAAGDDLCIWPGEHCTMTQSSLPGERKE